MPFAPGTPSPDFFTPVRGDHTLSSYKRGENKELELLDKREVAKANLRAFYQAARELQANWDESLNEGYPLESSFDEWVNGIQTWMDVVERGWPTRVSVLLYNDHHGEADYAMLITQDNTVYAVLFSRPDDLVQPSSLDLKQYVEWGTSTLQPVETHGIRFLVQPHTNLFDRIVADWQAHSAVRLAMD